MVVTIGICTSALQANIEKLLLTLMSLHLPMIQFRMVALPYNDLDSYPVERQGLDGLILCHSINNRRFAITDVLDALYDRFLSRAKRSIGKHNVALIVHDFEWPFPQGRKSSRMDTFQRNQPTAVDCSSLVILCGKLDNSLDMAKDDWEKLLAYASAVQPLKNVSIFESILDMSGWHGWGKSAISLVVCVFVSIIGAIVVIICCVSLIPVMVIVVVPVLGLTYYRYFLKKTRATTTDAQY